MIWSKPRLIATIIVMGIYGCTNAVPSAPAETPRTATAEQVIAAARSHVSMTEVVDVSHGRYGDLKLNDRDLSTPDDRLVWAVRFAGVVDLCPPSPHPCETGRPATSVVYLDYFTGVFVKTSTFSPNPNRT